MSDGRPWLLVAPWYRWAQPDDPGSGRYSRPAFQKYETADLVNEFLRNPRHSLRFLDEDLVHDLVRLPDPVPRLFLNRRRRLSDLGLARTDVRKIFLTTHRRFYLVVCELHCDAPGLPSARHEEACEAGFVVRRRVVAASAPALAEGGRILGAYARARQQAAREPAPGGLRMMARAAAVGAAARHRVVLDSRLEAHRAQLQDWARRYKVRLALEGWRPAGPQDLGAWQAVEETPGGLGEEVYPLYPLVPDPRDAAHAGRERAIYFGLLPAGSSETDAAGTARFDDRALYEVRCFVRRHDPRCPRTPGRGDCRGELVWSLPTEPYRLASQFDLVGTGNRPVTIQLPDLEELEAQATSLPRGRGAPVHMVAPEGSALAVRVPSMATMLPSKGSPGAATICSFSIPLITIVATFVLNLFLPIVVYLFGLYWLLLLKFCLPPSASIDAGLLLGLNMEFGLDLGLDASVGTASAALDAEIDARTAADVAAGTNPAEDSRLHALLAGKVAVSLGQDARAALAAGYAPEALREATAAPRLPDLSAALQYEDEVEARP